MFFVLCWDDNSSSRASGACNHEHWVQFPTAPPFSTRSLVPRNVGKLTNVSISSPITFFLFRDCRVITYNYHSDISAGTSAIGGVYLQRSDWHNRRGNNDRNSIYWKARKPWFLKAYHGCKYYVCFNAYSFTVMFNCQLNLSVSYWIFHSHFLWLGNNNHISIQLLCWPHTTQTVCGRRVSLITEWQMWRTH